MGCYLRWSLFKVVLSREQRPTQHQGDWSDPSSLFQIDFSADQIEGNTHTRTHTHTRTGTYTVCSDLLQQTRVKL